MITRNCDGCGVTMRNGFHKRGLVVSREYCDVCVVAIDEYLAARDEIHDDSASLFDGKLREAADAAADKIGGDSLILLPDIH